ncbi:MAG: hypothetical protein KQH79_05920 [Bacteroidetes bacterium]|nr:hypothetical protein [Bacteroidota bacterium]
MRKDIYKLITLILVTQLCSCSTMYIPIMPDAPLHDEKGDIQLSAGASTNSIHFSGNYAFSDNYALQFNGNFSFYNFSGYYDFFTTDNTSRSSSYFQTEYDVGEFAHKNMDLAIGKYDLLKSDWKLEAFLGCGIGNAIDNIEDMKSNYYNAFIQGNIGRKKIKHNFEYGWSLRLNYTSFQLTYPEINNETNSIAFDNISFEPHGFFRVGTPIIKVYAKVGFSYLIELKSFEGIDLNRGIKNEKFNYTSLHFSIGTHINLSSLR